MTCQELLTAGTTADSRSVLGQEERYKRVPESVELTFHTFSQVPAPKRDSGRRASAVPANQQWLASRRVERGPVTTRKPGAGVPPWVTTCLRAPENTAEASRTGLSYKNAQAHQTGAGMSGGTMADTPYLDLESSLNPQESRPELPRRWKIRPTKNGFHRSASGKAWSLSKNCTKQPEYSTRLARRKPLCALVKSASRRPGSGPNARRCPTRCADPSVGSPRHHRLFSMPGKPPSKGWSFRQAQRMPGGGRG